MCLLKTWHCFVSTLITALQYNGHNSCVAFENFRKRHQGDLRHLSICQVRHVSLQVCLLQYARLSTQGAHLILVRKQLCQRQSKSDAWHVWCVLKYNVLWKHPCALPMLSLAPSPWHWFLSLVCLQGLFIPVLYFLMLTHWSGTISRWTGPELLDTSICCTYTVLLRFVFITYSNCIFHCSIY